MRTQIFKYLTVVVMLFAFMAATEAQAQMPPANVKTVTVEKRQALLHVVCAGP